LPSTGDPKSPFSPTSIVIVLPSIFPSTGFSPRYWKILQFEGVVPWQLAVPA